MILPHEETKEIQDILNSEKTIEQKAFNIVGYYKSKIVYNRVRGRKQEEPPLCIAQVKSELRKRGDNITPIDIEV